MWGRKARKIKELKQVIVSLKLLHDDVITQWKSHENDLIQKKQKLTEGIAQLTYDNTAFKARAIKAETDLEAFRLQRLAKAANLPEAKTTYYPEELADTDLKKAQEHQDDNASRSSTGTTQNLHPPLEERLQPPLDDNSLPESER